MHGCIHIECQIILTGTTCIWFFPFLSFFFSFFIFQSLLPSFWLPLYSEWKLSSCTYECSEESFLLQLQLNMLRYHHDSCKYELSLIFNIKMKEKVEHIWLFIWIYFDRKEPHHSLSAAQVRSVLLSAQTQSGMSISLISSISSCVYTRNVWAFRSESSDDN